MIMYKPSKRDHLFYAHIRKRGKGTLVSLCAAGLSCSRKYIQMRLKVMTTAGYLVVDKSTYRGWVWTVVPDRTLPAWTSQTGPRGPRRKLEDPIAERVVTRSTGTVPPELLARLTLVGMVAQQLTWRRGT